MALGPVTTRVLEAGQGDRVIVFVHGTGGRADRWSRNLDAFADAGFHAYAFDLPGHGFASKGADVACSVPAYREVLGQHYAIAMSAVQVAALMEDRAQVEIEVTAVLP